MGSLLPPLTTEMRTLTEAMQIEIRQLKEAIQRLAYEVQRSQENEAHEREKLELRLEVEMLRAVKQLPTSAEPEQKKPD